MYVINLSLFIYNNFFVFFFKQLTKIEIQELVKNYSVFRCIQVRPYHPQQPILADKVHTAMFMGLQKYQLKFMNESSCVDVDEVDKLFELQELLNTLSNERNLCNSANELSFM